VWFRRSKRTALAVAGIVTATALLAILTDESRRPVVERVTLPIKALDARLDDFKIVQLSDIHLWPYTQSALVRRAVSMANALEPDLVLLTGDHVWTLVEAADTLAPVLAELQARYGTYAVRGNHDYWAGIEHVDAAFKLAGLPILKNEGLTIEHYGARIYLAGDDAWSGRPDLDVALLEAPAGIPVILLDHEPDPADDVAKDGRVDFQLSGHTHGGQARPFGWGPFTRPYLGANYPDGQFRVGEMWLYVNRGLGTISLPYRFNCPPEITLFTLTRA
jgi:predicted MPP superfamily phosphohydrolase